MNMYQKEFFRKQNERILKKHGKEFFEKFTYRKTHSVEEQKAHHDAEAAKAAATAK